MASISNTFESAPSGTQVSTSNSEGPSSRAFDAVAIGSGATLNYDSTHAHAAGQGTRGLKVQTGASAGPTYVAWGPGGAAPATDNIQGRCYLYYETAPSAAWRFFLARGAGANFMGFNVSTAQKIQIVRASGGTVTTGTFTLAINTLYRVEFDVFFGAGTSGFAFIDVYVGDSISISETITNSVGDNFGGNTADEYRFGINVSQVSVGPYWIDDININDDGIIFPNVFRPSMPPRMPRRARPPVGSLLDL